MFLYCINKTCTKNGGRMGVAELLAQWLTRKKKMAGSCNSDSYTGLIVSLLY